MKRSPLVTGVITIHFLATLVLLGLAFYLLWLARSPGILNEKDAAGTVQGLKIGSLALAFPAALWLPGLFGMWKRKAWAWWLTLITGAGAASVLIYSMIDDGWNAIERDDAVITAWFIVLPLSLLLPQVRKFYRPESPQSHIQEITPTIP